MPTTWPMPVCTCWTTTTDRSRSTSVPVVTPPSPRLPPWWPSWSASRARPGGTPTAPTAPRRRCSTCRGSPSWAGPHGSGCATGWLRPSTGSGRSRATSVPDGSDPAPPSAGGVGGTVDLRTVLHVVRTTWVSILAVTVAGALLALAFALVQPKTYRANASGIVTAGVSSDLGSALAGENLAKSRVKSYLDIAHSRSVAQRVVDELDLDASPQALVGQVSAINPIDTAVIQVTVSAPDPQLAAR